MTPIEMATLDTVASIRNTAILYHAEHDVEGLQHMSKDEFLRILALYFHDKSLSDWCRDLGIPDVTSEQDRARAPR